MAEAVDCLNDNHNRQTAAAAELIVGQNALIAALQQRVVSWRISLTIWRLGWIVWFLPLVR